MAVWSRRSTTRAGADAGTGPVPGPATGTQAGPTGDPATTAGRTSAGAGAGSSADEGAANGVHEGVAARSRAGRPSRFGRRRLTVQVRSPWSRRRPRDLERRPFPAIAADDPAAQREALAALRLWAEQGAEDAIDWYLRDKRRKRVGSRLLQGLAIAFAVAGTAVPLGTSAAGGPGAGWGYVLLAVAAGCKGFDYFFGLSSTWMRDIAVAQALRAELNAVRMDWATDVLRAGRACARPDEWLQPSEVERQLALITRLVTAVRGQIEGETADWQSEFRSRTRQLNEQGGFPVLQGAPGLPGVPGLSALAGHAGASGVSGAGTRRGLADAQDLPGFPGQPVSAPDPTRAGPQPFPGSPDRL